MTRNSRRRRFLRCWKFSKFADARELPDETAPAREFEEQAEVAGFFQSRRVPPQTSAETTPS